MQTTMKREQDYDAEIPAETKKNEVHQKYENVFSVDSWG
jgi:hypothetical protein